MLNKHQESTVCLFKGEKFLLLLSNLARRKKEEFNLNFFFKKKNFLEKEILEMFSELVV